MASRLNNKPKILVPRSLHPEYRETIRTYIRNLGVSGSRRSASATDGRTRRRPTSPGSSTRTRAPSSSSRPNFFGVVEDLKAVGELAHGHQALFVVAVAEAASLGVLEAPGELGADIVCGEGQSFGLAPSFRRSLPRLHGLPQGASPPAARPHRRPDQGRRRPARLRPDPVHPRTAHPPGEGDLEHLHEPGLVRPPGDDVSWRRSATTACARWPSRTSRRPPTRPPSSAGSAASSSASAAGSSTNSSSSCPRTPPPSTPPCRPRASSAAWRSGSSPSSGTALLFCVTEVHTKDDIDRLAAALEEVLR